MIVQICVGSSCHLKGSEAVVALFQEAIGQNNALADIALAGSFCTGRCNRDGVTVMVDDDIYTGITKENFKKFYEEKVLRKIEPEGR